MKKKAIIPPLDFEQILRASQKELKERLVSELKQRGYHPKSQDGFLYAEGTVPILLVAHLDTVHHKPVVHICYTDDHKIAMSPEGIGGDDRCGIYMILSIISKAPCHVLFCEDEEIGCVGAQKFTRSFITPQINYIVEIDRRGHNDAVFYECENPEFTEFICSFGFQEALGSCSDISYIAPYLGTAAVNISSGYYHEHQLHEYIHIPQMEYNINRICRMVQSPSDWFEYRECSYSFGFPDMGDYENYTLWNYMDHSSPSRTSMMKLPEDSAVFINRQRMSYNEHYYIDKKGNLYDYLPQLNAAVLCEGMTALTYDGTSVVYRSLDSMYIKVISLEKAIELLQAG